MKMSSKRWLGIVMVLLSAAILSACGGGGSSSSTSSTATSSVSGVASKGLLSGATVTVYSLNAAGVKGLALGSARTNASGAYSISLGSYSGSVIIEASGGSYTDEATGAATTNTVLLRAAVTNVSGSVQAAVTPLTEIAVRKAGTLTAANIDTANTLVSNMIGGTNIITTMPANVLVSSSSTTAAKNYGLALATISQMVSDNTASNVSSAIAMIAADLADDALDTTGADIATSIDTFLASAYNQSGLTSANTPAAAAITSAATGTIRNNWNINGAFKFVEQTFGFLGPPTAATGAMFDAGMGTLSFDGSGNITIAENGEDTTMNHTTNTIVPAPYNVTESFTYTTGNDGGTSIIWSVGDTMNGWLSMDGNIILFSERVATTYSSGQLIGVKTGSGMTVSSVTGTYWWTSQTAGFFTYNSGGVKTASMVYGDRGRITFDGAGHCSITQDIARNFDMFHDTSTIDPTVEPTVTNYPCTYTINSTGAFTVSDTNGLLFTGIASADGMVTISGGSYVEGTLRATDQMVAVKEGSGMTVSSATGTFRCSDQSLGFVKNTVSGDVASRIFSTTQSSLYVDGAGSVVWSYDGFTDMMYPGSSAITSNPFSAANVVGIYTVTDDGTVTATFPGPISYTAHASADGNILVMSPIYNGSTLGPNTLLYSVTQIVCVRTQ